jgi:putative FmdB family regulatory protein
MTPTAHAEGWRDGVERGASHWYNRPMPIFEYACQDCGREFEAFVTSSRKPACPGCEGEKLAKRLSSPGFVGVGAPRAVSSSQPSGGCGAGGAGCACKMN